MSIKQSSRLLIDEPALQVLPSLAVAVGLNEAIILQQVHYWLKNAEANRRHDNYQDGRWWVYNSYPEWRRDAFPWWSEDTIQRTFKNLEGKGLLITGKLSSNPYDQRKWYSIDYDALDTLNLRSSITATCVDASPQNAPMDDSKMRSSHHRKMRSCITENKTTTETTDRDNAADAAPPATPSKKTAGTGSRQPSPLEDNQVPPPPAPPEWDAIEAAPPEARGHVSDASTDPEALAVAIAEECGLDMRIKRQKKAALSAAQEISRAGATVGQVKNEFHTHWRTNVYRGMCGELATTYHLVGEWGRWEHIVVPPVRPGTAIPDPQTAVRRAIEQNQRVTGYTPPASEPTTRRLTRLSLVPPLSQTA